MVKLIVVITIYFSLVTANGRYSCFVPETNLISHNRYACGQRAQQLIADGTCRMSYLFHW